MSRLVFEDSGQFENWLRDHAQKGKYKLYITKEDEVVAMPGVSTRPLTIGYFKGTPKDLEEYKKLGESLKLQVYEIKSFEWDIEKPVGVKVKEE